MLVSLDVAPELLAGLPDIELRIALHRLGELVVALDRHVVLEHVQDEPLLDRLLHAVVVERKMPDRAVALRIRIAENLQRLVLRRGREGVVAGVGEQLARLHQALEPLIVGLVLAHLVRLAQHGRDRRTGLAALARMRLVDDHREGAPAMLVADLLANEGELLDRRDDDLLALRDEPPQIARPHGVPHRRSHLRVLPDRVADLLVQDAAVGDDDDRVEDGLAVLFQRDQLMGQPGDRIALSAARRMLDQVPFSRPMRTGVPQEPAHHVELLVSRPDLDSLLLPGLRVPGRHHLGVVLQNPGQACPGEDLAPQVVRPEAVRVGRIAGPAHPAAVEGQEPRSLPLEVGAEMDFVLVDREVRHAAPELEEGLAGVAVPLVLPDGVVERLLGEAVLELEGEDGEPVDEESDVQRALGVVAAVAELASDAELVLAEAPLGRLVLGGGRAVEEVEVVGAVLDAVAEDFDGAAFGDLALESG